MPSPRVTSQKWSHFESLVQTTLRVFRWYLHTLYYNSQRPGTQRTVQFYISNATLKAYNQLILVQQGVNNQLLLLLLKCYSHVRLIVTPWTVAHQAPLSMQARILEWVAGPSSKGSSQSRDRTHVSYISCVDRWVLYH